jgi:hypothetical protein
MRAEPNNPYGDALVAKYGSVLSEPFPDRFAELLVELDRKEEASEVIEKPNEKRPTSQRG